MPPKIETQEQMYPLTPEKDTALAQAPPLNVDFEEIAKPGEKGPKTLSAAIDKLLAGQNVGNKTSFRNAVLSKAVKQGFNVSLVRPGDKFAFTTVTHENPDKSTKSGLFLEIYNSREGVYYAVLLKGVADKNTTPIGDILLDQRTTIAEETRRAWTNLDEAFRSRILVDILAAAGMDTSVKTRKALWDGLDTETIEQLKKRNARLKDLEFTDYTGGALQNLALIDWLKLKYKKGELEGIKIAEKPAEPKYETLDAKILDQVDTTFASADPKAIEIADRTEALENEVKVLVPNLPNMTPAEKNEVGEKILKETASQSKHIASLEKQLQDALDTLQQEKAAKEGKLSPADNQRMDRLIEEIKTSLSALEESKKNLREIEIGVIKRFH